MSRPRAGIARLASMHQPEQRDKLRHRLSDETLRGLLYMGGALGLGGIIVIVIAIIRSA